MNFGFLCSWMWLPSVVCQWSHGCSTAQSRSFPCVAATGWNHLSQGLSPKLLSLTFPGFTSFSGARSLLFDSNFGSGMPLITFLEVFFFLLFHWLCQR